MKILFWFVTAIIVAHCVKISHYGWGELSNTLFVVGMVSWAPFLLAFIFHCLDKQDRCAIYVTACAFIAVSTFAIFILDEMLDDITGARAGGPGYVIVYFLPFVYIGLSIGGSIVGFLMCAIEKLIKKQTKKI